MDVYYGTSLITAPNFTDDVWRRYSEKGDPDRIGSGKYINFN